MMIAAVGKANIDRLCMGYLSAILRARDRSFDVCD
jgi:hypothetical protein